MLRRDLADIAEQANRIAAAISEKTSAAIATTSDGFSQMGSGSLPTQNLATKLVAVRSNSIEAGELAAKLRAGTPPLFARVHKGDLLLDPRTLLDGEEEMLVQAVVEALQQS